MRCGLVTGGITPEEPRSRKHRERGQGNRVDREGAVRLRVGTVEGLALEVRRRQYDPRVHVVRIELERLADHAQRGAVAVGESHLRASQQGAGVTGLRRDHGVVRGHRLGAIVAAEEEVAEGDARVPVRGVGGDRLVIDPERIAKARRIGGAERFQARGDRGQLARREPTGPGVRGHRTLILAPGLGALPAQREQIAEPHPRHQRIRTSRHRGLEQRLGLGVPPAIDCGLPGGHGALRRRQAMGDRR